MCCAKQFTQPQLKPQNPGPDGRYGCTSLIMKMYRNELSREIANPVHRKLNGMYATKRRMGICRNLKSSGNSTILIEMS
jgi:hypothetical protein